MKKSRYSKAQIVSVLKEAENARLKRRYAEVSMQYELIKEALAKKWRSPLRGGRGPFMQLPRKASA